ncbi:unnamed protein product [Zymoseptoria tritici ST99CH_1A5]|uniref:Uncharacterized protein n=1 Tax=Zymoseptoria tritici ST99CH_1A5 TaxID=1276529 RepID=A0A1Y6M0S8_ZYMTR|nr:unnamed protein product [Zymoseptoria tritici ST99CH_1A5]
MAEGAWWMGRDRGGNGMRVTVMMRETEQGSLSRGHSYRLSGGDTSVEDLTTIRRRRKYYRARKVQQGGSESRQANYWSRFVDTWTKPERSDRASIDRRAQLWLSSCPELSDDVLGSSCEEAPVVMKHADPANVDTVTGGAARSPAAGNFRKTASASTEQLLHLLRPLVSDSQNPMAGQQTWNRPT